MDKLPTINANAEVLDARCGKATLGEFNRSISSQLEHKANEYDVYLKAQKININDFDDNSKDALFGADINVTAVLGANNVQIYNLSEDFQRKNGSFVQYFPTLQNGFYSSTTGQFNENTGYKSFKQNVNAGTIYSLDIYVASTSIYAIIFLDSSNKVVSTLLNEVGEHNNYQFSVPSAATQMAITGRVGYNLNIREMKLNDNVNSILKNSKKIENINTAFKKVNIVTPTQVKTGFYTKYGEWHDNSSYKTSIVSCKAGDLYNCDTKVGSNTLSIVNFYDSGNNFISCLGGGEQGDYCNYEFTVPAGCASFSITNLSANPPIIRNIDIDYDRINNVDARLGIVEGKTEFSSSPSMYLKKADNDITIAWKYNSSKDIRLHIEKVGANGLYQIGRIAFVDNLNSSVSNNFSLSETVYQNAVTDWFSPYIMKAVNNGDGDKMDGNYDFVGGCHSYANTTTGVPTARLVSIKTRVNGRDVENGVYGGSKFEIILTNRIQGNNTKKADGTGREVLEECIRLTIEEGEVKIENNIKPLEEIRIDRYYGMQSYNMQYRLDGGTVYYVNGKDDILYPLGVSSSSGNISENSSCRKMIISNDSHILSMELEDIGLCKKKYIVTTDNLAFWSNDKLYFNLITQYTTLKPDSMLYWKGKYTFKSV